MSYENAYNQLKQKGYEDRIFNLKTSTATVSLAAKALNCKEENIAKTLALKIKSKKILIVTSGTKRINNNKYRDYFGSRPRMLSDKELIEYIGHSAGGVCPFGIKENIEIYLDTSLKNLDYIFPACGTSNTLVKLKLQELENIIEFENWVDVCE